MTNDERAALLTLAEGLEQPVSPSGVGDECIEYDNGRQAGHQSAADRIRSLVARLDAK